MDWGAALNRKYDLIAQDQASSAALREAQARNFDASAGLDRVRAGLLPDESRSQIALQAAQRGLYGAQARGVDMDTSLAPALARAQIGLSAGQAYAAYGSGMAQRAGAMSIMDTLNPSAAGQISALKLGGYDMSQLTPDLIANISKPRYTLTDPQAGGRGTGFNINNLGSAGSSSSRRINNGFGMNIRASNPMPNSPGMIQYDLP